MAYEMVMPYHLHMPSYFLETFTEYPYCVGFLKKVPLLSLISIIPLSASNRKGGKLKNMYISVSFNL